MYNSILEHLWSIYFFWFISSFIPLWSEKMFDMIPIFFNLLRLILCPYMWPILENVPWALGKNAHSAASGWKALNISIKVIWSVTHLRMLFPCWLSFWKIYWGQWGVKTPQYACIIVDLSLLVIKMCFMYLDAPMLAA